MELEVEGRRGLARGEGKMYVRVMTDEQMEVLRRQIAVYATICEQLVEMHKAFTTHYDSLTGMRMGNLYSDTLLTAGGHKITGRQRWTPTIDQLQILERIFDQENGAPSKQKIKEITSELVQHGQISETNVYNWFQNRRARSKRKQTAASSNAESEVEAEEESPTKKRSKLKKIHCHEDQTHMIEDNSQSQELISEVQSKDPEHIIIRSTYLSNDSSKSSGSLGQMSFYPNTLSNPNMNQPLDETEVHSWGPYSFSTRRAMI